MERLYARLKMPFWVGSIVIGTIPFFALYMGFAAFGGFLSAGMEDLVSAGPLFAGWIIYVQFASRYACKRIEKLAEYASLLSKNKEKVVLTPLYGLKGVIITWAGTWAFVTPLFILFPAGYQATLSFPLLVLAQVPWVYPSFFLGYFLWVWAYGMFKTYKLANSELKLEPFAGDRALGLKPFASASLSLTAVYMIFVAQFVFPLILIGYASLGFLMFYLTLFSLGLVFFILPLRILHKRLLQARSEELAWINQRYKQVMERIRSSSGDGIDSGTAGEITAIKEIQRDAQQIQKWPFDSGIVVRLTAIMLSAMAIILSRLVLNLLGL